MRKAHTQNLCCNCRCFPHAVTRKEKKTHTHKYSHFRRIERNTATVIIDSLPFTMQQNILFYLISSLDTVLKTQGYFLF